MWQPIQCKLFKYICAYFLQCVPPFGAVFVFVLVFVFVFVFAIHARQGLNNVASSRSSAVHKSFLDRSRKAFGQPKHHTLRKKLAILRIWFNKSWNICCNMLQYMAEINYNIFGNMHTTLASPSITHFVKRSTMIYLAILYTWFNKSWTICCNM